MPERKMTRCFMNGKSCIYERDLDEVIESRASDERDLDEVIESCASSEKKAFVIMPFGEQLDVLYQWEIAPFLRNGGGGSGEPKYKCVPERADDINQVGFVICEKICKKIQEAHYIVVDVSFDNPNVFYELGLATALQKEIIPICVVDRYEKRQELIERIFNISEKPLLYPRFEKLEGSIKGCSLEHYSGFEQMSGDNIVVLHDASHKITGTGKYKEEYDFGALCRAAVGTAVAQIFSNENIHRLPELKLYNPNDIMKNISSVDLSTADLTKVIKSCESAACVLVDVSNQNSIYNFFWLGYIHGIGGNAIPVNSYMGSNSPDKEISRPFDIRALWHIEFREDRPVDLLNPLQQILEHIYLRKAKKLNRKAFWKEILKGNKVSIFLGSLYLADLGRNTIGDWDYRAAAEIANYLSTSKETMKVTLESPLPKKADGADPKYVEWLQGQLRDNSIIIASADVNDLTEVAMCKILGQTAFKRISDKDMNFTGYIAHKKYSKKEEKKFPETAFYIREEASSDSRGFIIQQGAAQRIELMEDHAYPDGTEVGGVRQLLGQLVVAENPFAPGKWIVIISGISGPATLGIAQMLTGCMYQEFTINNKQQVQKDVSDKIEASILRYSDILGNRKPPETKRVDLVTYDAKSGVAYDAKKPPETKGVDLVTYDAKSGSGVAYDALSESMLNRLLAVSKKGGGGVNALVCVDVYYPPRSNTSYSNDERKVIVWGFPNLSKFMGINWPNPKSL